MPPSTPVGFDTSGAYGSQNQSPANGESVLTILWRYKWLIGMLLLAGLIIGYWNYKRTPTTFLSSTQLMFKSETPLSLDTATGLVQGGVPSGNLMESLVISDAIVKRVAMSPQLRQSPSMRGRSEAQVVSAIRGSVRFHTITAVKDSRDRMIVGLNYQSQDPYACVAAINGFYSAIRQHFDAERQATIKEIENLVNNARNKLLPDQEKLEQEYRRFRETAPLQWDLDGQAINPHRERQVMLQKNRLDLEQQLRLLSSDLRLAQKTIQRHQDPAIVAQVIGLLGSLNHEGMTGIKRALNGENQRQDDLTLQRLEVQRKLIPLQIKRDQMELQFGPSHPEVKSIALQIESSQRKLNELNQLMSNRIAELQAKNQNDPESQRPRDASKNAASVMVDAYVNGITERINILDEDMQSIDVQIERERQLADELKKAEENDASFNRRLETIHALRFQLEQQLAALNLAHVNDGIMVKQIQETSPAIRVGPELTRYLLIYGLFGLGISGLLAMTFEASAKMFRSAEEVHSDLRLPVLSHIPLDDSMVQSAKVGDPHVDQLDPKLAVVHRPYSAAAEAVRGVRTAMLFEQRQFNSKVFQVTSPLPGDGKSTLVGNIGCLVAQSGKRTLLIDLDLRSPRLSLRFNLSTNVGLTNVLNGELAPEEAVCHSPIDNLDILPCGPLPANPAEALALAEVAEVFRWARENYDYVIVDTPPLLMVSDPAVVTTYVDSTILVMRIRRRCRPNAREAVAMLRSAGASILGVVINKMDEFTGKSYYRSSASGSYQSIGYGYGDSYRRRYQHDAIAHDAYVVRGYRPAGSDAQYDARYDSYAQSGPGMGGPSSGGVVPPGHYPNGAEAPGLPPQPPQSSGGSYDSSIGS